MVFSLLAVRNGVRVDWVVATISFDCFKNLFQSGDLCKLFM